QHNSSYNTHLEASRKSFKALPSGKKTHYDKFYPETIDLLTAVHQVYAVRRSPDKLFKYTLACEKKLFFWRLRLIFRTLAGCGTESFSHSCGFTIIAKSDIVQKRIFRRSLRAFATFPFTTRRSTLFLCLCLFRARQSLF